MFAGHTTKTRHFIALLTAMTFLIGCETLQQVVERSNRPEASIRDVSLAGLNLTDATLNFDVDVSNPYSIALPLLNVDYQLASEGRTFLSGTAPLSGAIPAGGSRVVRIPATVIYQDLLNTVSGVRAGSVVPYAATLGLSVDAAGLGELSLPIERSGELPVPAIPRVELTQVRWKNVSLNEAGAVLNMRVQNDNAFPIDLERLQYGLSLAGSPVADVSVNQSKSIAAGGTGELDIPISVSLNKLGMAAARLVSGGESSYDLSGTMNLDTPYGGLDLPFSRTGQTSFSRE